MGFKLSQVKKYEANGVWTRPANVQAVYIKAMGGGGGGGGCAGAGSGSYRAGMQGQSGAFVEAFITSPPNTVNITVGTGGAGGTGTSAGANGGDSSFGTLVIAKGGLGGLANLSANTNAQNPPSGNVGDLVWQANTGPMITISSTSGVAVQLGQVLPYGWIGYDQSVSLQTAGGVVNGSNATVEGAGGGGSYVNAASGTNASGGNGMRGFVIVYEYE
ncbi:MAG: hypothetical protein N2315_08830 [Thermanaerothrix sp.]|nr:hypothetical protein [Thermanaerothrix sp.]